MFFLGSLLLAYRNLIFYVDFVFYRFIDFFVVVQIVAIYLCGVFRFLGHVIFQWKRFNFILFCECFYFFLPKYLWLKSVVPFSIKVQTAKYPHSVPDNKGKSCSLLWQSKMLAVGFCV